MANHTYTVTVASGNLYGGGTGNVFYLDGVRNATGPGTVTWVEGGTLRFDQSDSSNDNHPLIFSTTTSQAQIISSGVTYYLDGSSNQSDYTNTTTFIAATTRYVEVTPSSQTDFYYLCWVHGIGMGGIFDITSNTWGAMNWNQGSWAAQGEVNLSLTGSSLTPAIGSVVVDGELQVGWGGDTWGENEWGDLSGSQPILAGQSLSITLGSVTEAVVVDVNVSVTNLGQMAFGTPSAIGGTSILEQPTGFELSISGGTQVVGIGVDVTGVQANSNIGAISIDDTTLTGIGWGRRTWGNLAWGGAYSAQALGQQLTSTINFPADNAFTDVVVQPTGLQLDSTFANPAFSVKVDSVLTVLVFEDDMTITVASPQEVGGLANVDAPSAGQATMSIGNTVGGLKTPVDVTGIQSTMSLGNTRLVQTTVEPVTSPAMTLSLGQAVEIPGQKQGVSGLELNSSIGSVTITGTGIVDITGIQMTSSVGNTNITAWAEVDPGVNNNWTDVDLAA